MAKSLYNESGVQNCMDPAVVMSASPKRGPMRRESFLTLTQPNKSQSLDNVQAATKTFLEYGDFIYAIIRRKARDAGQVDDLFQDLFLALVSKPIPQNVQSIRGYLYRAIANDCIDAVRRTKTYRAKLREHREFGNRNKTGDDPQKTMIDAEESEKLFTLVEKQLTGSEAQAATLRYRKDLSVSEVGQEMGVKPQTVSRYLSVGLRKLREFLTQDNGDNNDSSGP